MGVCSVDFMRNLLSVVPKGAQDTVAAIVRSIFAQADHASAMSQLREVVGMLKTRFAQAAELLESAAEDLLAQCTSPASIAGGFTPGTRSSASTRRSSDGRT